MINDKYKYNLDISYLLFILKYIKNFNNLEIKQSKQKLTEILESLKDKYKLDNEFTNYINYCLDEISGVVKVSSHFNIVDSIELLESLMKHFCKDECQYRLSTEVICCLKY
jgi:hypothetical protein